MVNNKFKKIFLLKKKWNYQSSLHYDQKSQITRHRTKLHLSLPSSSPSPSIHYPPPHSTSLLHHLVDFVATLVVFPAGHLPSVAPPPHPSKLNEDIPPLPLHLHPLLDPPNSLHPLYLLPSNP